MQNQKPAAVLQPATFDELNATMDAALMAAYGDDINLDQSTPDGQLEGDVIQIALDNEDLLTQIYNGFDPDNAVGVTLDMRVAINGIQRQAGTRTITNIDITVTESLNLYGADQSSFPFFTVADNAGNQWILINTQSPPAPGTYTYAFEAAKTGAVLTTPNTITVPVSVVLGVTQINNPTTYTSLGINQESDAALRLRRQKSVSLASQGYLSALLAALENINGLTSAFVYENDTASTDGDGVPSHTIWVIVSGGDDPSIANAIYTKRNAGCGMFGSVSYLVTQKDGTLFQVKWDVVTAEPLFIKFTASSLDGINPPNISQILAQLPILFAPAVNQQVKHQRPCDYRSRD